MTFWRSLAAKKTTDDCYTPEPVYKAIFNWLGDVMLQHCNMLLPSFNIIRPFYPNQDYLTINYFENDLVLDNPPFSLYSKSSAQLLRFANNSDFNFKPITATEDFVKYDKNNKKIFGAAIKIGKTDNELFNNI